MQNSAQYKWCSALLIPKKYVKLYAVTNNERRNQKRYLKIVDDTTSSSSRTLKMESRVKNIALWDTVSNKKCMFYCI